MKVTQIYSLSNEIFKEELGETAILKEDLSNLVDLGSQIIGADKMDNYVRKLVDRIGKTIFVDRVYKGRVPSVLVDGWEWGSITQKIDGEIPEATENETWELMDGASYDPFVVHLPKISAKYYNDKVTFEIDITVAKEQVKSAFLSVVDYDRFVSMIFNLVEKGMTKRIDGLVMRTINNVIAETVYAEYGSSALSSKTGIRAVNLLKKYNDELGKSLTVATCLTDLDFLKYASTEMSLTASRMGTLSKIYNVEGKERFTPDDMLKIVLLDEFAKKADNYLQSDTFHNEFTALPNAELVSMWQGSGTGFGFSDISKIYVTTASGHDVTVTGVLGFMFDRDALGVKQPERSVETQYNPKNKTYNYFYQWIAGYFNDLGENAVCFFIA